MRLYFIVENREMMNKSILVLLLSILGLNIFDIFIKDNIDLTFAEEAPLKDSKSCVNLDEKGTFSCLSEVVTLGTADGNDLLLLGQMYLYGMGVNADSEKAISLFETSAIDKNNDEAMALLGDLHVKTDMLAAKYWYARSAKSANLDAQLKLANIYRHGAEVDQNPAAAFELYKEAASKGSFDAQYELALMYAMGIAVEPNLDRSLFMLEAPCDRGHAESCALLSKIQELKRNQ